MPSTISLGNKSKLLQQRLADLRQKDAEELRKNRQLLLRHNLLSAWCDCLSHIQLNLMRDACWASAGVELEFEKLLEAEGTLLKQLSSSPSASQMPDARAVLDVGVDTIAPLGDPMAYFKHHISRAPMINATTITLQGMSELMRDCTHQLSMQLHILESSDSEEQQAVAMEQLKEGFDRVVHAALSLVLCGREDVVEHANIVNLQTLSPDIEGATKQAARTAALIDKIGLTPQQLHTIATGSTVYMQMLTAVVQERQGLQSTFAAADGAQDCTSTSSSSGTASSSRTDLSRLEQRQQRLEAQQKQAARLQLLIRKEMLLRVAGMTWFLGCLSVQQVAKACVLCWPFTLRPSLLAQEVQKRVEAAQQQPGSSPQRQACKEAANQSPGPHAS